MSYDKELEVAQTAIIRAGQNILEAYAHFQAIPHAPASITTDADRESQEVILQILQAAFPGDAFCAEENTPSLQGRATTGSRLWVIDPIDGSRGFAQKNGQFSVMIGFVEADQLVLGLVLEPVQGRLTFARRGMGCWRQDGTATPVLCQVSGTTSLATSSLVLSHIRPELGLPAPARALGSATVTHTHSAGVKLVRVARGEADLYLSHYVEFHDWDICAGHLLVEEAGGQVTGLRGETIRYGLPGALQRYGLLASNGLLHSAALKKL